MLQIITGLTSFADEDTGASAFGPHGLCVRAKHFKGKHD